jgi:hypothetical protein
MIPLSFKNGYTSVIIGGHSPNCRWYSEDAVTLADNIKVIFFGQFIYLYMLNNLLAYGEKPWR